MKKTLSFLLILGLLFSLGGVGALAADAEEIAGTYSLTAMDDGSGEDYEALLKTLSELGMYSILEIDDEGHGTLNLFGTTEMELEFNFARETVKVEGTPMHFSYEDGILEVREGDYYMTFTKGDVSMNPQRLAFDLYRLEALVDDGEKTEFDSEEEAELYFFRDGSAVLTADGEMVPLLFDLEEETVTYADGSSDILDFTVEDGLLTIERDANNYMTLRQVDPGWAGPYVLTAIYTEANGDQQDDLDVMNGAGVYITLDIEEDGTAVMDLIKQEMSLHFDFRKMVATAEDDEEELSFTYENGELVLSQGGEFMRFERVLSEEDEEVLAAAFAEIAD